MIFKLSPITSSSYEFTEGVVYDFTKWPWQPSFISGFGISKVSSEFSKIEADIRDNLTNMCQKNWCLFEYDLLFVFFEGKTDAMLFKLLYSN